MPAGLLLCQETHDLSTPPQEPSTFLSDVYCTHAYRHNSKHWLTCLQIMDVQPAVWLGWWWWWWLDFGVHATHCNISKRCRSTHAALWHLKSSVWEREHFQIEWLTGVHCCISSYIDVISHSSFCPSCLHNNFLWPVLFCWWIACSCVLGLSYLVGQQQF